MVSMLRFIFPPKSISILGLPLLAASWPVKLPTVAMLSKLTSPFIEPGTRLRALAQGLDE